MDENPLETISDMQDKIDYMTQLEVYIDDDDFMEVMNMAVKIIAKNNVPGPKVAEVCTRLEAHALMFRTKFVAYQSFLKEEKSSTHKKNLYKEMYTGIDRLVDALKYQMK